MCSSDLAVLGGVFVNALACGAHFFQRVRDELLAAEARLAALEARMQRQRDRTPVIPPTPITLQINVADHIETRTRALLCHKTQIHADSQWLLLPPHLRRIAFAHTNLLRIIPPAAEDERDEDLFPDVMVRS